MRIGFIGLGLMGKPIATNLVKAGFAVVVHNRSQGKVDELVALGAERGTSPAQVAGNVDVVMTCLPDVETDVTVITGPNGVLEGARPGTVLVDLGTIRPATARELAEQCAAKSVTYLDAPVSGSGSVAWRGELTVMVGGDREAFERVLPVLQAIGKHIRHMGPVGSGHMTKLLNGMLRDINAAAAMEALVLGAKAGIDPKALFEVIRTASGASGQWERNVPKVLTRDFSPEGAVRLIVKDTHLVEEIAEELGLRLPLHEAARAFWDRAVELGLADEDPSAGIKVLEKDSGLIVQPFDR